MTSGSREFRHLNVDGRWPGFHLEHLTIRPDGSLALASSPESSARLSTDGQFVAGPVSLSPGPTRWGRLRATVDPLPDGAHLQLFTCSTDTESPPPVPMTPPPEPTGDTPAGVWRPAPADATDLLALTAPASRLWIAGRLHGDGATSPVLRQLRVDAQDDTWLELLPRIYREDDQSRSFLSQLLAVLQAAVERVDDLRDDLPLLFDATAVSDSGARPTWLDRLAGLLGTALDESADERQRRDTVASTFRDGAGRGTADGLQALLERRARVRVRIEEPGQWGALWSLGRTSRLGLTTLLPLGDPQGAVVGTTATLGQSHVLDDADYGAPALGALAGRVTVSVYAAQVHGDDQLAALRGLLDREGPAHVDWHVCLVRPQMRVGWQARVGVDTIVGRS